MLKKSFTLGALLFASSLSAHCQVPCGIYHDEQVIGQMEEMIETMEKACSEIKDDPEKAKDYNQMVRWVMTKEDHCDRFASLLTKHFLQQRIKTDADALNEKLASAHKLLVLSMKVKQDAEKDEVKKLSKEFDKFKELMNLTAQ